MKKLKLIKVIKESIQTLLQDQFVPVGGNYRCVQATTCSLYGNHTMYAQLEIGGNVPTSGDLFQLDNFSSQVPGSQPSYVYSVDMVFPAGFTANPGYSGGCMLDHNPASLGNGCSSLPNSTGSGCATLTQPVSSNWSANVQAHGWETSFECLIEAANNPCSLLREKIRRWGDKYPNVGPNQQTQLDQRITFAVNLGNSTHSCNNLDNLSPGSSNTLNLQSGTWDETTWTTQFTNMINGAGNPCNVLQNKINGWNSKLQNIGASWSVQQKDMLLAKIDVAEDLQTQNNC